MMGESIHLVTSGPLPADAIALIAAPGNRPGVGGNIASSRAIVGRFEAKAVSDITKPQIVRRLIHGKTVKEGVMEEIHPAMAGMTCCPSHLENEMLQANDLIKMDVVTNN